MTKLVIIIESSAVAVLIAVLIVTQIRFENALHTAESQSRATIQTLTVQINRLNSRPYSHPPSQQTDVPAGTAPMTSADITQLNEQHQKELGDLRFELDKNYQNTIKTLKIENAQLVEARAAELAKLELELTAKYEKQIAELKAKESALPILGPATRLASAVTAGIDYKEYSKRVTDARIELDEFYRQNRGKVPAEAKDILDKIMEYYKDAYLIWQIQSENRMAEKIRVSAVYLSKYPFLAEPPNSFSAFDGKVLDTTYAVPAVWAEAAKYIAEAEKQLIPGAGLPAADTAPPKRGGEENPKPPPGNREKK